MAVCQWQLLQLMTVDTPEYYNSGGFYKIGGTCLKQLDNICKCMYHTHFSHLILLIFILLVWPYCIWCYLVTASYCEGWPFILFWAVCVGCVLDRIILRQSFAKYLWFPLGVLSFLKCCAVYWSSSSQALGRER